MAEAVSPSRLYVVTVGFDGGKITSLLQGLGLASGDHVLAVNSVPKHDNAKKAMQEVRSLVTDYGGVYHEVWLDPRPTLPNETTSSRFRRNVALIRSLVEEIAPREKAVFAVSGGFRVIGYVVEHAAMALVTVWKIFRELAAEHPDAVKRCSGSFTPPQSIGFIIEIEEDKRSAEYLRKLFPSLRDRLIEVSPIAPLADLRPGQAASLTAGRLYILAMAATREYLRPGSLLRGRRGKKPGTPLHRKRDLADAVHNLLYSPEAAPAARPYTQQCLQTIWGHGESKASYRSLVETVRRLINYAEKLELLTLHPLKPTELAIALTATHNDLADIIATTTQQETHT